MIAFESYKNNLDVIDKFNIQSVILSKGIVCGDITTAVKKKYHDVDPEFPPLASAVIGPNNTAATTVKESTSTTLKHSWVDIDTQQEYLESKPTCFLILSKPGAGAYHLGEAMAKYYKCIHVCPRNVLIDEMEQKSDTGKCIDYNMKHNNVMKASIILPIIKEKLKSPTVMHRGYVLSGLPLISTDKKPNTFIYSLNSEESIIIVGEILFIALCEVFKKKEKKKIRDSETDSVNTLLQEEQLEANLEEEEEEESPEEQKAPMEAVEEEDETVELPKFVLNTCDDIIHYRKTYLDTKQNVLLRQLSDIFNLDLTPDLIIYITSPDADLITKKYHKFHNYKSNINFADTFSVKKETEIRWPLKYPLKDYYEHIDNTVLATKYICRQPMNFRENSVEQMCNYRKLVLPFIENKLNDYSPKHIIKIDARTAVHEMMHQIMKILRLLPIVKPVIIPEPLYMAEPPEDLAEFWKYIDETNFVKMGKTKFSRYPSPWYNRCPVELKKGRCLLGKIKFAVQFFKHVYLLSSHEALITFYSNPRPYLHLKYLEPTCRIFVLGTKSSGKTMVAQCLSWIFDSPIIKFTEIVDKWKKSRLDAMMSKVFPEILPLIEQAREGQWQIIEGNRITELNNWHSNCLADLKKYVVYAGAYKTIQEKEAQAQALEAEKRQKKEQENLERGIFKPLPKPKPPVQSKQDKKIISGYNEILEKMQEINLPEDLLEDLDECRNILMIKDMYKYAPEKYLAVTETPAVPLLEDDDVQKSIWEYIEENDLRNELETTPEEVVGEISQIILSIDKETEEKTNFDKSFGQYIVDGFPSEPEYWEIISKSKLLPDHTIAIMENRELDIDLIKHYKFLLDCSKHYEDRFACADDPLIKIKVMTKELAGKCRPFEHIPSKRNSMDEEEEEDTDFSVPFTQELDNFFDNWDNLKMRLEDNKKLYIEVSLENMSDIDVMENVLIKLRQNYYIPIPSSDDENAETAQDEESEEPQDMVTYNHPVFLCETGPYCPIAYYDHGVLWEGKSDFSFKYDNKMHYFCKQECMDKFKIDVTKYQAYNKPYKKLPPLRICLIGCNGYGRSSAGKYIAKELGVIHVDFLEFINHHLLPRHFKRVGLIYENVFKDVPFDEKTVKDFQTDEDSQNIDPMTDEMELRSMVFEYYERGSPLLSPLLQKLLKRIWFAEPFVSTGFVLDGFPRVPSDVEDMTALFCVPDVVIDLEGSSELSLERVVPYFFNIWKTQQNEEKLKNKIKMDKLRHNWLDFITKKVVVKLLIDEVIENAVSLAQEQVFTEVASTESAVIDPQPNLSGTMDMGENLFNAYNEIIEEYPEPIDESEWEEADEAKERIGARMESIHDSEEENLDEVKDLLTDQGIKIIAVDASKTPHKVWRRALINLTNYRNRTTSFFEQTFVVSCDVAEVLIAEGFCFLSKFHRLCPVHLYENPQIILNPHEQNRRNNTLYPVVHRSFIYYINGEEALKNFRLDPLLYVPNRNVASSHEYTLRIGIVGPPKSGKSTLAAKVSKKYGLKCISRGNALRNILQNLYWTKLGTRLKSSLESGGCVKTDDIVEAVHMALIDHHTVSCGFVLDGFPETPSEAMELHKLGIYPQIIFDISSTKDVILDNSQKEVYYNIIKTKPPYCQPFINARFTYWKKYNYKIKNYIKNDFQNTYLIDGNQSRWHCFQEAQDYIDEIVPKIYYYLNNRGRDRVVPMDVMCISNELFQQKMSCFKKMCPVCICSNSLKNCGYPVDKKGVVLYKESYFWICAEHMELVKKDPEEYLAAYSVDIPEIPAVVSTVDVNTVYENGICIVTYGENLPRQCITTGNISYAATYQRNTYLFCDNTCLEKFLAKPHWYYNITIFKETRLLPKLSLKKLPNLGYLEQTVGNILTDACCAVNVLRPKYPGLDIAMSGAIFIGLFLKVYRNYASKDMDKRLLYLKAYKLYEARSKLVLSVGLRLRAMDNPFANYPNCCFFPGPRQITSLSAMPHEHSQSGSSVSLSNLTTSRVPVPDERFDYLCEYHKPASKVPAFLNVVDIAGLVRGAAEGQGLGNAFLSHIKACDAIFNLCRAFDDEDVIHVDGEVNPVRDLETIGEELRLKDVETLTQTVDKLDRQVNRGGDKKLKPEYDSLTKIKAILVDEKKHTRFGDWSAADIEVLNKYLFLTSKPALYLVNLSEKDYIRKKNKWLPKLKEWIDKNDPGAPLIPFSGVLESKLMDMDAEEKKAFLKEHNITSALDKIIVQGYKALHLEYFFTAGADEVKAWTIQKGTKAPQAAGRIHTDFEKGFIMAEVMHYKDFKEEGTEAACKSAGKYRQQGRNYMVEDGDIIFFKFNAGAGLKDAKKK